MMLSRFPHLAVSAAAAAIRTIVAPRAAGSLQWVPGQRSAPDGTPSGKPRPHGMPRRSLPYLPLRQGM